MPRPTDPYVESAVETFDYRACGAQFISDPTAPTTEAGQPAPYFRREFNVADHLLSAHAWVTGLGLVEPHVNGAVLGSEVLEPGWTSYRHRLVVRRHDITELVQPGPNAIGAIVGEGWATGRLGYEGIARRHHFADRSALFVVVRLTYRGSADVVVTDRGWHCAHGAIRTDSIYDGVTVDSRLEPSGWDTSGYDDTTWRGVEVIDWPIETLIDPVAPPIRRIQELAPTRIWRSQRDTTVVDFGQNLAGWVKLRLSAPPGHTVTVEHSEVLVEDEPDYTTLRLASATDRYTLAGLTPEVFEPRFTYHGFRYAEITGLSARLDPRDVTAVVVHSDMNRTGWWDCSNPLINRLHDNIVWSMRGNFVGLPTDCPQRDERLGYTGDINAFLPTATYLYDVSGVLGSWLDDLAAEQSELGYVPYIVPDVQHTYKSPTALWSDAAVSVPWGLYWEYGDLSALRRAYPSMSAFVRSVQNLLDARGLWSAGFQFGDWLDPAAPMDDPRRGRTDPYLVANAYLVKVTRELAQAATALDLLDDAKDFGALAQNVLTAFRKHYVTADGRLVSDSATAYALAIRFDLLTSDQMRQAGDRLDQLIRIDNCHIATGFAGTPHLAHALSKTGHTETAYSLLLQEDAPSFLHPVTQGATTVWERWDAILPDGTVNPSGMTSLNHYALGSIAEWLHKTLGGIEPTSPSYRTIKIAPQPGGNVTWVRAAHVTRYGCVKVEWHMTGATVSLIATIPPGCQAEVHLPLHADSSIHQVEPGTHHWSYPAQQSSTLSIDSPVRDLVRADATWKRIAAMLCEHLSDAQMASLQNSASLSLSRALDDYSVISRATREDLTRAIAS